MAFELYQSVSGEMFIWIKEEVVMKILYGLAVITTIIVTAVLSGCDSPMGSDEPKPKGESTSPPPVTLGNLVVYAYSDESEFDSVRCFVPSYSSDLVEMLYDGDRYAVNIQLNPGSYNIIAEGYRDGQATCSGFGTCWVFANRTTTIDISLSYNSYEVISSCELLTGANKVVINSDYAYVSVFGSYPNYDKGFQIVDISDPVNPAVVGFWQSPHSSPHDIAVSGDNAYVICGGLKVIDVCNPFAPSQIGFISDYNIMGSIAIQGNYAYTAGHPSFIYMF